MGVCSPVQDKTTARTVKLLLLNSPNIKQANEDRVAVHEQEM